MDSETFDELLKRVGPLMTHQDTRFRKAIPPSERLALTLRFLATGMYAKWNIIKQKHNIMMNEWYKSRGFLPIWNGGEYIVLAFDLIAPTLTINFLAQKIDQK